MFTGLNSLSFEVWYMDALGRGTRQAAFKRLFEAEKYILLFHSTDKDRWYIQECTAEPDGSITRRRVELSVKEA